MELSRHRRSEWESVAVSAIRGIMIRLDLDLSIRAFDGETSDVRYASEFRLQYNSWKLVGMTYQNAPYSIHCFLKP